MIDRFFTYSLAGLITIVAGMQFIQVIMRYVLKQPLMGLEEILIYPTLWLYFLGSVNASREDTQIKANVLDIFCKTDVGRKRISLVANIMSIVVSSWLTWWAWRYFAYSLRIWKESPTLYIPMFYAESAVFIGLLLMTLYVLYHLYRNFAFLFANNRQQ
jgi:TRAP-type C4-dicarboxylate transport system permease small subunit